MSTCRTSRNLPAALALSSLALFAVSACGGSSEGGEERVKNPAGTPGPDGSEIIQLTFTDAQRAEVEKSYAANVEGKASFSFDSSLSADERTLARQDMSSIARQAYTIESPANAELVKRVFGGADARDVLRYLSDRVRVFVGPSVSVKSSGEVGASGGMTLSEIQARTGMESDQALPFSINEEKSRVTAQNVGTVAWYFSYLMGLPLVVVAGSTYPVSSMRAGIISLMPGYTSVQRIRRESVNYDIRLSTPATLVHEARHSDCSTALTAVDGARLRATRTEKGEYDLPQGNTTCGHLHVMCPKGHPLEGKPACDDHFWGSYQLGWMYSAMVAELCTNCSDGEIARAQIAAEDSRTRILDLGSKKLTDIPAPDMSHRESPALSTPEQ